MIKCWLVWELCFSLSLWEIHLFPLNRYITQNAPQILCCISREMDWHFHCMVSPAIYILSFQSLICLNRQYVQCLTSGVSSVSFKLYKMEEEASNAYHVLMLEWVMKVVRDLGDEVIFGPAEQSHGSFCTIPAACVPWNGIKYIFVCILFPSLNSN